MINQTKTAPIVGRRPETISKYTPSAPRCATIRASAIVAAEALESRLCFSVAFTAGTPVAVGTNPGFVVEGDFNGDGKADLAIANSNDNTVTILLGTGSGTFTAAPGSPIAVGTDPAFMVVGDFNGDGKLDLAVANSNQQTAANTVSILLGNGDGTFTPAAQSPIAVGNLQVSLTALATGDFNGDNKLDLALTNSGDGTVSILLGNGDGTFTPAAWR